MKSGSAAKTINTTDRKVAEQSVPEGCAACDRDGETERARRPFHRSICVYPRPSTVGLGAFMFIDFGSGVLVISFVLALFAVAAAMYGHYGKSGRWV